MKQKDHDLIAETIAISKLATLDALQKNIFSNPQKQWPKTETLTAVSEAMNLYESILTSAFINRLKQDNKKFNDKKFKKVINPYTSQ